MNCCANCFGDSFLEAHIAHVSVERGQCVFCRAENVELALANTLTDYFELVASVYRQSEGDGSKSLAILLADDWIIGEGLEEPVFTELLNLILPHFDIKKVNYVSDVDDGSSILELWEEFRHELKHENRFFPTKAPDPELLRRLLPNLETNLSVGGDVEFYRARRLERGEVIEPNSMGAPPADEVQEGRANPIGIPYLYLASDIKTAIAETRPHKGDRVFVGQFRLTSDLKMIDLRGPRRTISPFKVREEDLKSLYTNLRYFEKLGEELSKPVKPEVARLEYLPSQFLCELVKHCGFDGVIFSSSLGDGHNFAVFYHDKYATPESVVDYTVTTVDYGTEPDPR